ncbi:MAG: hypothetical protein GNW80_09520 [Asgard group archaeon]|nr:hypothetical protein [Asgard group archaeon]
MKNQGYEDTLLEEMKSFFGSDSIDDPKKLCQYINQKTEPFIDSLKKKDLLEAFEKLDSIAENIPIFALGENLSDEVRKNRLLYFAIETIQFLGPLIQIQIRFLDFSNIKITKEEKEQLELFKIPNFTLLNAYVREWETQFSLFVKPVYKNLLNKQLVRENTENYGNWFYIKSLKDYFEKDKILKTLNPIMDFLDANLRNAIVHQDYYIDEEEDCLYYYDRRNRPDPSFIEISELGKKVIMLYLIRIITGILICRKMV